MRVQLEARVVGVRVAAQGDTVERQVVMVVVGEVGMRGARGELVVPGLGLVGRWELPARRRGAIRLLSAVSPCTLTEVG